MIKLYFISRQDILEEIISEKDSQIAELEMKGVLDESETKLCDALKCERDKLLVRLKNEVRYINDSNCIQFFLNIDRISIKF